MICSRVRSAGRPCERRPGPRAGSRRGRPRPGPGSMSCSTTSTVVPWPRRSRAGPRRAAGRRAGARPSETSSSSSSRGLAISARPMASICCSPPDRWVPGWSRALGQDREQLAGPRPTVQRPGRSAIRAPTCRFSSTVRLGKIRRPSGTSAMPRPTRAVGGTPAERPPVEARRCRSRGAGRPGDGPQQRRLAGAVGADHGDRLALVDLERDVEQGLEVAVEAGQVASTSSRLTASPRRPGRRRGPRGWP